MGSPHISLGAVQLPCLSQLITICLLHCLHARFLLSGRSIRSLQCQKLGDRSDPTNYRPISLLCVVSKVLERIVYEKVAPFIRPLLSHQQFGFLKNRSCLTQLLLAFSDVNVAIENKRTCSAVYVDFRKAFDSVPHNELFKLWQIGITGPLWQWFREYLSCRQHFVSIDGCTFNLLPVLSGVPQGSILGLLLFIIYVNDIPERILHSSVFIPIHHCTPFIQFIIALQF